MSVTNTWTGETRCQQGEKESGKTDCDNEVLHEYKRYCSFFLTKGADIKRHLDWSRWQVWIGHDGRWFLKSASKLGFDVATQLNLAVTKSFGKTEITKLLSEFGKIEIKNIGDFADFLIVASEIYCPPDHKYEYSVIHKDNLSVKILQCYVFKNVNLAGTTQMHQCAGKQRFNSWLEALDLKGTVLNLKNTDNCNGKCEFIFNIQW